jgi:hypothetical protein
MAKKSPKKQSKSKKKVKNVKKQPGDFTCDVEYKEYLESLKK